MINRNSCFFFRLHISILSQAIPASMSKKLDADSHSVIIFFWVLSASIRHFVFLYYHKKAHYTRTKLTILFWKQTGLRYNNSISGIEHGFFNGSMYLYLCLYSELHYHQKQTSELSLLTELFLLYLHCVKIIDALRKM